MNFKSTQVTKLNDFQLTPSIVLNMEFLPINHSAAHTLPLVPRLWGVRGGTSCPAHPAAS